MKVFFRNSQKSLIVDAAEVRKAVCFFLQSFQVKSSEVAVYFVTGKKISQLHKKYFNDPSSTDCLSFPFDPPGEKGFLGEVFICPQTAIEYAEEHSLDPYEEALLYLIHSLLHLLGYKDAPRKERILMQKKEKEGMKLLKTNLLGLIKKQWQ